MKDILQRVLKEKNSIYPKLNDYLNNIDVDELIDILNGINQSKLYNSYFHGLHHSQKVCFFAYLIGKQQGLNEVDMQILMDAAIYHDIGRLNDNEERYHGYNSARQIDTVVTDAIYQNEDNLSYLKAICEAHSFEDEKAKNVFGNYEYENPHIEYSRFIKLCNILKDADSLDRARFKKTCKAALKEKYLRLEYSKSLVELATLINDHYTYEVSEIEYEANLPTYMLSEDKLVDCFHGIGFDFFKLESILKHGILSNYQAIKEKVGIVRNFNGNNKNIWISVVSSEDISKDGKAYNRFIKEGISFHVFTSKLNKGINTSKENNYNIAIKSSEYEDEHFAFNKIPVDNIHSIIIFKDNWNKNIGELFYLFGNNNYDVVFNRVVSYVDNIRRNCNIHIDLEKANDILAKYQNEVLNFESLSNVEQMSFANEFIQKLDLYKDELNREIQKWLLQYYKTVLGIDNNDVKVSDVVMHVLGKTNIVVNDVYDNEDEIMFIINPLMKMDLNEERNRKSK